MDPFLFKLILSFIVGGFSIAFTIWLSEKFGSKVGGLISGLPTTLLVSLIFIAWTQSPSHAVDAIPIIPAGMAATTLFLVGFIILYRHGKTIAMIGGIIIWVLVTLPLLFIEIESVLISLLLAALFFAISISYLRRFPYQKLKHFPMAPGIMLFRIALAGGVVAVAVLLGKILGPLWGGLFASFPAAFSSSMYLLERAHGITFASSVARTMPYGTIGSVVFALAFFFLVPPTGIVWGTIFAYIASLIYAVLIYYSVLKKS